MTDLALLTQALLAAVPADGSIGNQSLIEQLRGQFAELTEEQFWAARDALIEQGVLQKGRGRGGSVLRAQASASSVADQALSKARERFEPAATAELSASYVVQAAAAVKKGRATKVQPAISIEAMEKTLWATADKLRANMDAAEYKHIVLGLIFLKYISDSFAGRRAELERKLLDENDDYYLGDDDPEALNAELEDRDYYREVNVFWVPEVARWESIRAAAKQVDIGKRIDDALATIEAENPKLKNILDKRYARAQLPDGKLGELVDLISTIGFGDDTSKARDLLGQVYEYFLGQFASAEGKKGGQFYTSASIVKTLVAVLNPHHAGVEKGIAFNYVPGRNNVVGNSLTGRGFSQQPQFSVRALCWSGWQRIKRDNTYRLYLDLLQACLGSCEGASLAQLEMALFANAESQCVKVMNRSGQSLVTPAPSESAMRAK
jgi:type I restriction enzyme M protein